MRTSLCWFAFFPSHGTGPSHPGVKTTLSGTGLTPGRGHAVPTFLPFQYVAFQGFLQSTSNEPIIDDAGRKMRFERPAADILHHSTGRAASVDIIASFKHPRSLPENGLWGWKGDLGTSGFRTQELTMRLTESDSPVRQAPLSPSSTFRSAMNASENMVRRVHMPLRANRCQE